MHIVDAAGGGGDGTDCESDDKTNDNTNDNTNDITIDNTNTKAYQDIPPEHWAFQPVLLPDQQTLNTYFPP